MLIRVNRFYGLSSLESTKKLRICFCDDLGYMAEGRRVVLLAYFDTGRFVSMFIDDDFFFIYINLHSKSCSALLDRRTSFAIAKIFFIISSFTL